MANKECKNIVTSETMVNKECKHSVAIAFNGNEIVSYCSKCGKILDLYKKVDRNYYTTPYINGIQPVSISDLNGPIVWDSQGIVTSVGDPYTPEMNCSHPSTSNLSDITERIYKYGKENKRVK